MLAQAVTVDVAQIVSVGAGLVILVGGIAGALAWMLRRFRAWLTREVGAPARLAADRLRTTNGHSVGDYVEQLASDVQQVRAEVGEVKSEIGIVTGWAAENRDLAHEAKTLAQHAHERFDAWLAGRRADKEG